MADEIWVSQNAAEVVGDGDNEIRVSQNAVEVVGAGGNAIYISQNAIEIVYGAPPPDPPTITSACPLPRAERGVPYSYTFSASGGAEPYVWSIVAGSLPAGLTMSSGGVISGTPTVDGLSQFRVLVQST